MTKRTQTTANTRRNKITRINARRDGRTRQRPLWWFRRFRLHFLTQAGALIPTTNKHRTVWVTTRPVTSLGHQEGWRVFGEGPKIFWTMSNNFNRCPIHFSKGGAKNFLGGLRPPWLRAWRPPSKASRTRCRRPFYFCTHGQAEKGATHAMTDPSRQRQVQKS